MQYGEHRIGVERLHGLHLVEEGGVDPLADEGVLQQVVELLEGAAGAEIQPLLLQLLHRQALAVGQAHIVAVQVSRQPVGDGLGMGEAGEEGAVLVRHSLIGGAVDLVCAATYGGHAAGEVDLVQAVREQGEIGEAAKAAEALAKQAPGPIRAQGLANVFGVPHYAVGAKMAEIVGLLPRGEPCQRLGADGGGVAGAALIEQQHPKFLQGPLDPAAARGRARRAKARPPLQIEQPGQLIVQPVLATESAAKQGDALLVIRFLVVEGHGEEVWLAMDAIQHIVQGAAHLGSPWDRKSSASS